jgi:hypothetical protein
LRRELRVHRDRLAHTLAAILESAGQREEIAGRSYWHPNGFAKLVLADQAKRGQLRLHVWPEVRADDDVHGHSWFYESVVLTGEVTERVYQEAAAGEGRTMWRHSYDRVGHRRYTFADPVEVQLAEAEPEHVYRAGAESGGDLARVHRFFASSAPAATLLRVGPVVDPTSHVYRTTAEPPHLVTPRPTTRAEVCTLIDLVARSMGA